MTSAEVSIRRWVTFGGLVLVVVVLRWGAEIFIPIAFALLLTFLLNPSVSALQRWIGRVAATVVVVLITTGLIALLAWTLTQQVTGLAGALPSYRANIRQKIEDIRGVGRTNTIGQMQQTLSDIQHEVTASAPNTGAPPQTVVVASPSALERWGFPSWVGALSGPVGLTGFAAVLVLFMLLEVTQLRERLISLVGSDHLARTTRALDEAAARLSRYLLRQTLVNVIFGCAIGLGLWLIGVPYPLVWGALGVALRFIPYGGPWLAAAPPLLISLAELPGWRPTTLVIALFVGVEIFTNLVLEAFWYADAIGVSQVGLLIAIAFWTWLWGPIGLLLAAPLTICLVVFGNHVPAFAFLAKLMASVPAMRREASYYQRLLAHDHTDAADAIGAFLKNNPADAVFDGLMLPALAYARRDRREGSLSAKEEEAVHAATRVLLDEVIARHRTAPAESPDAAEPMTTPRGDQSPVVFGYPVESEADELALHMLAEVAGDWPMRMAIASPHLLVSELAAIARDRPDVIICLAHLPTSPQARVKYVIKRVRQAAPDVKILVGRWAPDDLADADLAPLVEAGATAAAATLTQTRDQLRETAGHRPDIAAIQVGA